MQDRKDWYMLLWKDTVTTDKEYYKIETDDDPQIADTAVSMDAVVHDHVPVLTSQNLKTQTIILLQSFQLLASLQSSSSDAI